MTVSDLQRQFLTGELGLLRINAALATRNAEWPVYGRSKTSHQRTDAKYAVRHVLKQVESDYRNGGSQAANHTASIAGVAAQLSGELSECLFQERFRFGIAQLRQCAGNMSLAEWELREFERRRT